MTGVLKPCCCPNFSATDVANGKTVDEPTTEIWSRANAVEVIEIKKALNITTSDLCINRSPRIRNRKEAPFLPLVSLFVFIDVSFFALL